MLWTAESDCSLLPNKCVFASYLAINYNHFYQVILPLFRAFCERKRKTISTVILNNQNLGVYFFKIFEPKLPSCMGL